MKKILLVIIVLLLAGCGKPDCENIPNKEECIDILECMPVYNQGCVGCDKDPEYIGCAFKEGSSLEYAKANKNICLKTGGDWNDSKNTCRCNGLSNFQDNKGCIPN